LNIAARLSGFFAGLSPRTLAWSASLGAFALVLQAAVIGAVLMNNRPASFETASLSVNGLITRDLAGATPVRFVPDACMGDITALLDKYQASIIGGAKDSMFRLQFANATMSKDEFSVLLSRVPDALKNP
jgi:hypothetical protein